MNLLTEHRDSLNYESFADMYYAAHRVPVSVFSEKNLLYNGYRDVQDFNLPLYLVANLPDELPQLWYAYTSEQLYFGGITLPVTGNLLFVGPVLPRAVSRVQAAKILRRLGRKETDIPVLMQGLDSFQNVDLLQLKSMLSLLMRYFYSNHVPAERQVSVPEPVQIPFTWAQIFPAPPVEIHEPDEDADPDMTEQRLSACIRYGRVEELEKILNESVYTAHYRSTIVLNRDTQRQYITGANTHCSRLAVEGGLPQQLANELSGYYMEVLMAASSERELEHVFYRLITDYTQRVHDINLSSFSTPTACRVHHYVYAHIYEKLSTRKIAAALHMSESYLCKSFKKETGLTIVAHIQKCKMEAAEYLLATRQYTAAQISDLLCFSSQSYFTSVFHKYTGKTPGEFR